MKLLYVLAGGVGSFAGVYLPVLLGVDNGIGFLSIFGGLVGGIAGIILAYRLSD
jgi:hypothetical protein